MTYSSRNFLISWGVGSDDRVPRFSKRLSSAMMSLQTSTHSSQMKTVGPGDQFADVVLVLVAERAPQDLGFAALFHHGQERSSAARCLVIHIHDRGHP